MALRAGAGRFKLRIEPYDPNARDADNDGIVQEGTAFERPGGTRIVDRFGDEIRAGLTATQRSSSYRVVGRDGTPVAYVPTYDRGIDPMRGLNGRQTSSPLGLPNLRELGLRTLGDRTQTLGDRHKAGVAARRAAIRRMPEETLIERQKGAARARVLEVLKGERLTDEERRIGQTIVVNAAFWATTILPGGSEGILTGLNDALTGVVDSDTNDSLAELRELYSAAGVAAVSLAMAAARHRLNASKEQMNEWTAKATEWLEKQKVKAGEVSDRLKTAMRTAMDDLLRFFTPNRNDPDGRMQLGLDISAMLTADDFTPPQPPLDPQVAQQLDKNLALMRQLDALPSLTPSGYSIDDALKEMTGDTSRMMATIDSDFAIARMLYMHKYASPQVGLGNIDIDASLAKINDHLMTKYRLPSIISDENAISPSTGLERIGFQQTALMKLTSDLASADRVLQMSPEGIRSSDALDALAKVEATQLPNLLNQFGELYESSSATRETVIGTREALSDFVYAFSSARQARTDDLIRELSTKIKQDNEAIQEAMVDSTPGMLSELTAAVPMRPIDPRLGTTGTMTGIDLLPRPKLLEIGANSKIQDERAAVDHLKSGGSLSEVPHSLWRKGLVGASSEKEIDTTTPFYRIKPEEGAVGDTDIFLLRDKDGKPTSQGWVTKGSAVNTDTTNEVIGWNLAVAHGISKNGATFDGDTDYLESGTYVGQPGVYAITPYAWSHLDADTPGRLTTQTSSESAYSLARIYATEFEGYPEMFAGFLHSHLLGLEDRHPGNTLTAKIDGQPVVMPIDLASAGKQLSATRPNDPLTYAMMAYSSHSTILYDMKELRKTMAAEEKQRFDKRIAQIYDSMAARAEIIANMDENDFIERFAAGLPSESSRHMSADEVRAQARTFFELYRRGASDMKRFRDSTLFAITG